MAVAEVKKIFFFLVKPIAEKYCLLLNGEFPSPPPYKVHCEGKPSIGNISLTYNSEHEPSPIAPFTLDAPAWVIFSKAVQASFGPEIIVSPSAMTGNTGEPSFFDLSGFCLSNILLARYSILCEPLLASCFAC